MSGEPHAVPAAAESADAAPDDDLASEVSASSGTAAEGAAVWVLVRQDDNGNRYVVARYSMRGAAEAAAAEFEARGHKQLYWVERAAPTSFG
jgi:hypothetical protein